MRNASRVGLWLAIAALTVGWVGVLLFHVLLMLFGPGFWLWSVPALALLLFLARRDLGATT